MNTFVFVNSGSNIYSHSVHFVESAVLCRKLFVWSYCNCW